MTKLRSIFGNGTSHKAQLFNWVKPKVTNVYIQYVGHGAPGRNFRGTFLVPSDATAETMIYFARRYYGRDQSARIQRSVTP